MCVEILSPTVCGPCSCVRRLGFGYCKRIWRINECGRLLKYLNLLDLWCMIMYALCHWCKLRKYLCYLFILRSGSVMLCIRLYWALIVTVLSTYAALTIDLNLFIRLYSCNSFFVGLYLLFVVIIHGFAHVDAKGLIYMGPIICDLIFVKSNATLPNLLALSHGAETWFWHPPILLRVRLWLARAGHYRKSQ